MLIRFQLEIGQDRGWLTGLLAAYSKAKVSHRQKFDGHLEQWALGQRTHTGFSEPSRKCSSHSFIQCQDREPWAAWW